MGRHSWHHAPLVLADDPACTLCCRMTLWLARHDRQGLLNRVYLAWAAWRFRRTGRQPFA